MAWAEKPASVTLVPTAEWRVLNIQNMDLDTVRQYGGDPAIEREYGVSFIELRNFRWGIKDLKVVVEPSPDASTAFGLLTFYQTGTMTPVAGLPLAYIGPDTALLARGRYFFRVPRPPATATEISNTDLGSLLSVLVNSHPLGETNAGLPNPLPRSGLIPGSEKYLLGDEAARHILPSFRTDLIGFTQGAEVQLGDYATAHGRATVMAIAYPTPQIARARYIEMGNILGLNQDHGAKSVYGRRLGSYMLLVLGSDSPAAAKVLMAGFGTTSHVVQNERYPGDKSVPVQMMELIVANLIFSFILAGIGVGGGIIMYLSKRMAQRWLPQTQWGQEDGRTIITLKLS